MPLRAILGRTRPLVTAALVAALAAPLAAHDFWIEPSTYTPAVGEPVRIQLRVGEHFAGEPVARNNARLERFVLVGPSGEQPVAGRQGMHPAGLVRIEAPGIWYVAYRSTPSAVELEAGAFERYLREEGLERIIDERAARNESAKPGRERFSRSVKALVRAGNGPAEGYDRPVGLTLEFVPGADPAAAPDGQLPLRLLHDGEPLEGALVVAYRKTRHAGADVEGRPMLKARTNGSGEVMLPLSPGIWLVKAVHMEKAQPGSNADWESTWTALTFEVPAPSK